MSRHELANSARMRCGSCGAVVQLPVVMVTIVWNFHLDETAVQFLCPLCGTQQEHRLPDHVAGKVLGMGASLAAWSSDTH